MSATLIAEAVKNFSKNTRHIIIMKECCVLKKNTKYGSFEMTCICGAKLLSKMQHQLMGLI